MRVELREIAGETLAKHPVTGKLGRVPTPGQLIAVAEVAPGTEGRLADLLRSGHVCVVSDVVAAPAVPAAPAKVPAPEVSPAPPAPTDEKPQAPRPRRTRRGA